MAKTNIRGTQIADASVDLTVDVTGIAPVANGGTGSNTIALNNLVVGNGTGAVTTIAPGSTDTAVLQSISSVFTVAPLDTFMGQPFETRKLMRSTTLTASTDFVVVDSLKVPTTTTLKIPTTSSLKILGVVDPKKNQPGGFAGLDSTFGRSAASQVPYQELVFDFTKYSAGAMPTLADTGQATQLTYTPDSTSIPVISTVSGSGRYTTAAVNNAATASYLTMQLAGGATYMECDFVFDGTGSTTGQRLALVCWTQGLPIGLLDAASDTAAAHIVFGPLGYDAAYYSGGTQGTVSPNYGTLPGTSKQHVEVAIDIAGDLGPANTVYVRGPDGQVNSFTWAGISGMTNNTMACCEIAPTNASTDARVQVQRFAAASTSLKEFGLLATKARLLVQQGLPGKDVALMGGNPFQTRQAGQMTDPYYVPYPRNFSRVRYAAVGTTQVSAWTWKLTDKITATDVTASSGTSGASATTVDVVGPFAFATGAMPYVNIATLGATPGLGCAGYLVP